MGNTNVYTVLLFASALVLLAAVSVVWGQVHETFGTWIPWF